MGAGPVISGPPAIATKPDVVREPELGEAAADPKPSGRASKTPLSEIHPTLLHLGQTVRRSRKAKGLTQMQLAQRCGFNSAAIFMVEAGRQNMTIKSLMAIAAALELEVGDLFPRTTPRTSAKLTEVADTIGDVKGRVVMQLQMLDRLAVELREEAGTVG
ncbi:helix-turn-helix domain-containing protein [Acidisoma sp. L85]|uniref:helix-turn-helix domain-containing protein n=1 Tax=Acidisoma sp. L85 TaxID=1641850 RepID=UPI00131DBCB1|nr:helix-turn-helix transcriptional regulator [Acidisoma sp. L85]